MQTIDIQINNAKIQSYTVTLKDDLPEVNATVGLYSGEKKVSEFSLNTQGYYQGLEFDLPTKMIKPIVDISKQLEVILTQKCKEQMKELPESTEASDE